MHLQKEPIYIVGRSHTLRMYYAYNRYNHKVIGGFFKLEKDAEAQAERINARLDAAFAKVGK